MPSSGLRSSSFWLPRNLSNHMDRDTAVVAEAGGVKTTENKIHWPRFMHGFRLPSVFFRIFFEVLHFINQGFLSEITVKSIKNRFQQKNEKNRMSRKQRTAKNMQKFYNKKCIIGKLCVLGTKQEILKGLGHQIEFKYFDKNGLNR